MEGEADIGGAPFAFSYERSTVVDYSVTILVGACRFFIQNPKVRFSNRDIEIGKKTSCFRLHLHILHTVNNFILQRGRFFMR